MQPRPSIPRRVLQGTLVGLFAMVLLMPLAQQTTRIPEDRPLGGFRYRTQEFPQWTCAGWLNNEFAPAADAWIGEHLGLRGWLVMLNRQIRYSLFGQVEAAPLRKRALVIGKPPYLFENILLLDARLPLRVPPDQMEAFAGRLARTRDLLRDRGMAFLVVVAPNKALIYTNALPAWARARISGTNPDQVAFKDALARHAVPVLDTQDMFRDLSSRPPDVVPPHGIHWSHYGAWLTLQQAIPLINRQAVLPALPVPGTEDLVMDTPSSMNDELRGQLNLFSSRHGTPVPSAYPVAAPLPPGAAPMLDVLVVGDSFGFTFLDALARSRLCRTLEFWFYAKNAKAAEPAAFDSREIRGVPRIAGLEMPPGREAATARLLAGKNLVFLVVTTFNIDKLAWNFDQLVEGLYGDPARALAPAAELPLDLEN